VPNRSNTDLSNTTLDKLLEADSLLATQEATLTAQLELVHERRQSLKVVLDIFSSSETIESVPAVASEPTQTTSAPEESPSLAKTTASSNRKRGSTTKAKPAPKAKSDASAKPQPVSSGTESKSTAKAKGRSSNRANSKPATSVSHQVSADLNPPQWQPYIKQEFNPQNSLAEIVSGVMRKQPDRIFEISDMMDVIFTEGMSSKASNQARGRVSNILSTGARRNEWYRPKPGFYSFSQNKAKAVSTS
jgi:hypothetical protein